jgi:hypothetical protein
MRREDGVSDPNVPPSAQMKYVAAYLLAVTGGNASPSAADIKTILGAAEYVRLFSILPSTSSGSVSRPRPC